MKTTYEAIDILRGLQWYRDHKNHVDKLMEHGDHVFPATGSDISRPELWKAASWRWFFSSMELKA